MGSFLTLPAYAWPEVDHMNMCGSATKTVHGGWKGWAQHDRFVAKRGNGYYFRTNCPNTKSPVKKATYKKPAVRKVAKRAKPAVIKSVKRMSTKSSYNEKLDCARVDRMNAYGASVGTVRSASISATPVKRNYNYFKKR